MAFCNLITSPFRYLETIFPFIQLAIILFFLPPFTTPITFNLNNFRAYREHIELQGNASITSDGKIDLTTNQLDAPTNFSIGRVIYANPVRLWDPTSGLLADFTTHFNFSIKLVKDQNGADGITFFLTANGSFIPPDSIGGCFALFSNCSEFKNSTESPTVAVEFDTFPNEYDPIPKKGPDHVGIDINSIRSVTTWNTTDLNNGSIANAWITYNSTTHNLSVFLSFVENPVFNGNSILSYVVDLRNVLPQWVTVGFSATTGRYMQVQKIYSWEFNSTEFPSSLKINTSEDGRNKNLGLVIGSAVGGSVLGCGMVLIWFLLWGKRIMGKEAEEEDMGAIDLSMDDEFEKGIGPRRFSYAELVRATNNFAEGRKIGQGGFGAVYRGVLTDLDFNVAVKRVSKGSKQGKKEYISELKTITRLRHRNLVRLIGWSHERSEFFIVYEFMPNGSLDSHIFQGKSILTWSVRYNIALGLASALFYLHEEWEQCVVHRDVKSSNVMLDSSFNARLGDFGLARLVDHQLGSQTTMPAGTLGYLAPECITSGKTSKEADVYSFGVVALEIACGRRAFEPNEEESKVGLVGWVWELYRNGKLLDAADEKLRKDFDKQQMERLMVIGLWCANFHPNLRPFIRQAISVLKFDAPMPDLPFDMSKSMYAADFSCASSNSATATNSRSICSSSTSNSS